MTGSRVEVDRPEPSAARDDPSGLVLRRVRPEDVADCLDVFYVALEDLDARSGRASTPRNPASLERLLGHLVTTDPERAWLAEGRRGVAGFGLAMQRETSWFLSFLFVRPEHQATGVGRRLLEACLPAGVALDRPLPPGGPSLGTCIDAIQPISAGLYSRYGMVPRVPLYACLGRPRDGALPGLPPSVESLPFETLGRSDHAGLAAAVELLDRSALGYARALDHRWWRTQERSGFLYRDRADGRPLAYGYAHPSGRIGPVASVDAALVPAVVGALLGAVEPTDGCQIIVPGPASETLRALLAAGMRFSGTPGIHAASSAAGPSFERYLPATFALL